MQDCRTTHNVNFKQYLHATLPMRFMVVVLVVQLNLTKILAAIAIVGSDPNAGDITPPNELQTSLVGLKYSKIMVYCCLPSFFFFCCLKLFVNPYPGTRTLFIIICSYQLRVYAGFVGGVILSCSLAIYVMYSGQLNYTYIYIKMHAQRFRRSFIICSLHIAHIQL